MAKTIESLEYFDTLHVLDRIKLHESIARMNEGFKQWLVEEGLYTEATASQPKIPWQQEMISSLQTIVGSTAKYAYDQMPGDQAFLNRFGDVILNLKGFPPKPSEGITNATNYQAAIQRLSTPLSSGLSGIDLSRIEDDEKGNLSLKKQLIPPYDGKDDFSRYAKVYYYGGEGARQNLAPKQVGQLLQTAYQFCSSYQTRIQSIQTDVNGIVNFIKQDPNTGQIQQQIQSDLSKISQLKATQQAMTPGMASTNPGANAGTTRPVNADTDFSLFMEEYFGPDWKPLDEAADGTVSGRKKVNPVTNPQETRPTPVTKGTNQTAEAIKNQQKPRGVPVDASALAKRKQEIVARVVRDALAAKLAAMSMVYRDFMLLMRTHVAAYHGAQSANFGGQPAQQQQPPQQQQRPVQPQQQQPQ